MGMTIGGDHICHPQSIHTQRSTFDCSSIHRLLEASGDAMCHPSGLLWSRDTSQHNFSSLENQSGCCSASLMSAMSDSHDDGVEACGLVLTIPSPLGNLV